MSNLTDAQKKRIQDVRWATNGKRLDGVKDLGRADIELLVARLDDLEIEEYSCAEELMKWIVKRLQEERDRQSEWLLDCLDQVRTAELLLTEADSALTAAKALVDGGMFTRGEAINKHWDDAVEDYRARGWLPELPAAEDKAPAIEEGPASATAPVVEPPTIPTPAKVAKKAVRRPIAKPEAPAEPTPRLLGALSYTRPGDPLTDKQANVFRAILSAADAQWRAVISQGRIAKVSGEKAGGMGVHLDALERKDYIRILDRGNSTTAGSYLICDRARPERKAPPKTDAELIAEAVAAGRVTKIEPPDVVH